MTSTWSNYGKADIAENGTSGQTLRMLAVTAAPPNAADSQYVSDISDDELTGTGYSRQTLASVAVSADTDNDKATITCDDVDLGSIATGETIAGVWIYRRVGASDSDTADILWCFVDTNDLPTNGADVTYSPGSSGFASIS